MTRVTCRQTAKNWDQLQNPALGTSMGYLLPFLLWLCVQSAGSSVEARSGTAGNRRSHRLLNVLTQPSGGRGRHLDRPHADDGSAQFFVLSSGCIAIVA